MTEKNYLFAAYACFDDDNKENELAGIFTSIKKAKDVFGDGFFMLIALEGNKTYPGDDPWRSLTPDEYQPEMVWFPNSEDAHGVFVELLKE